MTLTSQARRATEWILARRGYVLRRIGQPPRGFRDFLALYRLYGPTPEVVFDIGVGNGTPWLYEAFSDARFVLVEPLTEFAPKIDEILKLYRGQCHYCALGERKGESTIYVPLAGATGSSLLPRDPGWAEYKASQGDPGTTSRVVPVSTLDQLAGSDLGPHVVKIDVEGTELEVLRGGRDCVRTADMIIVECSVVARHSGESGFMEIGSYLSEKGFVLVDVIEMATYGRHGMLAYLDAVFMRKDNPFLSAVSREKP